MKHEEKTINKTEWLKGLSQQDFLSVGMDQIAYVKPIKVDHGHVYALYGADGSFLSTQNTLNDAVRYCTR